MAAEGMAAEALGAEVIRDEGVSTEGMRSEDMRSEVVGGEALISEGMRKRLFLIQSFNNSERITDFDSDDQVILFASAFDPIVSAGVIFNLAFREIDISVVQYLHDIKTVNGFILHVIFNRFTDA